MRIFPTFSNFSNFSVLAPLKERFQFRTVPFGSSVNVGNEMEPRQKRRDMKEAIFALVLRLIGDDSFVCFVISRAKYRRKLDFCDRVHIPPHCNYFQNRLEPFHVYTRSMKLFGSIAPTNQIIQSRMQGSYLTLFKESYFRFQFRSILNIFIDLYILYIHPSFYL